ncbi:MAG: cytochrome b561 domain-containing protein [Beijerinckiaceae bacterium]
MLDWLMMPMDPARAHDVSAAVAWHGRTMTLAWGVAVPLGVFVARYLKVLPNQNWPEKLDSKFWWNTHQGLHYLAGLLTLTGVALVLQGVTQLESSGYHALFGWAVVILATAQFLGGWLRGSKGGPTEPAADGSLHGDHYSMTLRRLVFEYVHKTGGYLALGIAITAILTGLWRANAPVWMWLVLLLWWAMLVILAALMQRQGRAVDTYQAIWGPDAHHPGNARKPIGFGINRPFMRKPEA